MWRKLLVAFLAVSAVSACGDEGNQTANPAATATAQPATPTPSPLPTATPVPECEPLREDVGFPVMLGRVGDDACVIWGATDGARYRVLVEQGKIGPLYPATNTVTIDDALTPLTLPQGAVPALRGSEPCFQGEFMVSVLSGDGERVGGELWRFCEHQPVLADGCAGPSLAFGGGINLDHPLNDEATGHSDAWCITWEDRFGDETGFRIELTYPNSGEKFTYTAPPGTVEFIPPAADVDGLGQIGAPDFRRKDYGVRVWALRPGGEELVGSISVQVM